MNARSAFVSSIEANATAFGVDLSKNAIDRLADHYELILEHNPILHLVGPCSPEEMATRHFLESLTMLKHLPLGASFADIGSGGGFPAIPCLIVRKDISAVLIESKEKKAKFLQTVVDRSALPEQAEVINKQFSEAKRPDVSHVTCRALDGFIDKLPKLLRWSGNSKLLFYGGEALRDALKMNRIRSQEELMPLSEQRYLFHT